ncbi:MAG: hypothetical protein ACRCTP_17915 [Aeromonas popoffii]|uniref:hypothetical protein n=1 Tax=Aeromonas popoffii TaxID=70856 RepID=UPI003F2A793C
MNKHVKYEWDAEIQEGCPVTGEVLEIEHYHHPHASRMLRTMEQYPVTTPYKAYCPVVVRDVEGFTGQSLDRQWAYLIMGEDGKWTLPDHFIDGCDVKGAKVPKYLKTELEKAQK